MRDTLHSIVAMDQRPLKLPLRAVVLDVLGALLCATGLYGVLNPGSLPGFLPFALIVVGIALMGYGMVVILSRIRDASRR